MKNLKMILVVLLVAVLFTGCADVVSVTVNDLTSHTYGFWGGLWHGMIAPFDFIGSLIWDDVAVYARNNNGGWYDFGFILGIGCLGGGSKTVRYIK